MARINPKVRATLQSLDALIGKLSTADLTQDELSAFYREVNQRAIDYFKQLVRTARKKFKVGDQVEFTRQDGTVIVGTVTKILPKNIAVLARSGVTHGVARTWRVAPTLLRPHSVVERIAELGV